MNLLKAGDVAIIDFAGAMGTKRRPGVILSSDLYHSQRPDSIMGLITTNLSVATADSDYLFLDWIAAGLRKPSAFRSYFGMELQSRLRVIGHLSDRDWTAVQQCLLSALA